MLQGWSASGQNRQKQSEGVCFCYFDTQNTVPYCQKYTPTDCFFGDFAHSVTDYI